MRETLVKSEEFKDSPVGKIPKDWEVRKLTDITSYQNGKSFPSSDYSESGIPLLRPGNLPDDDFVLWDEAHTTYLPLKWAELAPDYIVLGEELVMNLTAQSLDDQFLGRVCMTPPETFCLLNQRIARFRAKHCSLPFLFWALKGTYFRAQIDRIPQGTKVQHIYNSDLDAIILPMPKEQSEQRAIAEILFTLSALLRSQESLIAKLKQMKAGLLHDLLTRGLEENGELRDAIAHPEQFKDSPLGQIPKDWEAKPLAAIADLQVGFAFKSEWFQEHEGIRLLRGENVGYGSPDWFETRTLPSKMCPNYREYELVAGDIIIGMDRTFTKSGFKISVLEPSDVPALLVQRVGRFLPIGCDRQFLKVLLNSQPYHAALLAQQKGMDIPHLSKSEILEPLVAVPPVEEQRCIATLIDTYDTRIRSEESYREKLKLQKQGLMHDLLTGKVRVKI